MQQQFIPTINAFLREKDRKRVHHVEFSIPGTVLRLWIMDAALLPGADKTIPGPVVYFSVNRQSGKGRQLVDAAELLGLFDSYTSTGEGRYYSRYKPFKPDARLLADEIAALINGLFPVIDRKKIETGIYTRDSWMEIEE